MIEREKATDVVNKVYAEAADNMDTKVFQTNAKFFGPVSSIEFGQSLGFFVQKGVDIGTLLSICTYEAATQCSDYRNVLVITPKSMKQFTAELCSTFSPDIFGEMTSAEQIVKYIDSGSYKERIDEFFDRNFSNLCLCANVDTVRKYHDATNNIDVKTIVIADISQYQEDDLFSNGRGLSRNSVLILIANQSHGTEIINLNYLCGYVIDVTIAEKYGEARLCTLTKNRYGCSGDTVFMYGEPVCTGGNDEE
jgi:hypothetical protein